MSSCYPAIGSGALLESVASYLNAQKPYKFLPSRDQPTGQLDYMLQLTDWMQKLEKFRAIPGVIFSSWVGRSAAELLPQLPTDLMITPSFQGDVTAILRQVIDTTWEVPGVDQDGRRRPLKVNSWSAFKMMNMGSSLMANWAQDYSFESPVFRMRAANGAGSILVAQLSTKISGPELLKAALAMIGAKESQPVKTLMLPKVKMSRVTGEMPWMKGIRVGGGVLQNAHFAAKLTMDHGSSSSWIDMEASVSIGLDLDKVHWVISGPMVRVHEFEGVPVDIHHVDTDAYYS